MKKKIISLCAVAVFAMSGSALGLSLTPADCTDAYPCWTGTETGLSHIYDEIAALSDGPDIAINETTSMYKQDFGGGESGDFAPYYETSFQPFSNPDPTGAIIEFVGPSWSAMAGAEYLFVKDGSADPAWYLFDLNLWNGTDDIVIAGFWEGVQGAISHVSIYGDGTSVPEPATLLLLGTALGGLVLSRRRGSNSKLIHGKTRGILSSTA